ncbi:MAG: 1,4-dihydroxy-2-naphthoyl-CoA hydrolase [Alteromonas macleodii]|jgi:1,4-dihydroxy-2-naphthoyl-CoA hydrolase
MLSLILSLFLALIFTIIAHSENLPEAASGLTTIVLKSNYLGTVHGGVIECVATPVHNGRTIQVWDATVSGKEIGKTIAIFRCRQMVLYPK